MRESEPLTAPASDAYGFVKTLNNQGFMIDYLDPISQAFVDFSPSAPGPVLDIGASYGVASIAALKQGATVIANDLDPRHLKILQQSVEKDLGTTDRLRLLPGKFPDDLPLPPQSLGAVLACRVFHFFDGPTIEASVSTLFNSLVSGGRFFLVGETPWVGGLAPFWPIYEERKRAGVRWPGNIEDFLQIDPHRGKDLPKSMHLLDPDVLRRVFEESGFAVERVEIIPRPHFPPGLKLDGRESVGIVGRKP